MQKIRNPLRGVLDNLRGTPSAPTRPEWPEFEDNLRSEHFQSAKTIRHGFPHQPTAMAFDPVQNLLAIGTRNGSIRIFGTPGVDCHMKHEEAIAITQLIFLVNEGALISICSDDTLYLWTLRQKKPEIIHSLKFQRERITVCHLPFRSEYLYIGTERGNVYVAQTLQFQLSGYLIHWNKAIELSQRNHPGSVIHLSDNPLDQNQLLIGFESGVIVLWDLKLKAAEFRFSSSEPLRSISWNSEGKQFMSSHTDGSLAIWNVKASKPASSVCPHAKISTEGKPEPCRPIRKVEWKTVRNGEPFQIFNGGMAYEKGVNTPSLTVIHGKSTTVLEMEHKVIDFITLCPTPWTTDFQEPYGIVVLLQNDLVVIDLNSPGYPCFENPYAMDIHESAVTACQYYANCSPDLIPAFYCVGSKQKRTCFSEKKWPIHGGEWGTTPCSYSEIIITGHADGSLKFWDASAVTLQQLYKLKTAKVFDRSKCRSPDSEDDPFAIQHINLCEETRLLLVAGHTHLMLFKYSKSDSSIDVTTLDISITYEIYDELDSPDLDYPSTPLKPSLAHQQSGSLGSYSSSASANDGKVYMGEPQSSVKVKTGARKWTHGYQPDLCCVVSWIDGEPPPVITSVALNTKLNLFAFGNECGLGIVDIAQKTCLLNMGTPDLYGSMDPYSRAPRSPRSKMHPRQGTDSMSLPYSADDNKSTSNDQIDLEGSMSSSTPAVLGSSGRFQRFTAQMLSSIKEGSFDQADSAIPKTSLAPAPLTTAKTLDSAPVAKPSPKPAMKRNQSEKNISTDRLIKEDFERKRHSSHESLFQRRTSGPDAKIKTQPKVTIDTCDSSVDQAGDTETECAIEAMEQTVEQPVEQPVEQTAEQSPNTTHDNETPVLFSKCTFKSPELKQKDDIISDSAASTGDENVDAVPASDGSTASITELNIDEAFRIARSSLGNIHATEHSMVKSHTPLSKTQSLPPGQSKDKCANNQPSASVVISSDSVAFTSSSSHKPHRHHSTHQHKSHTAPLHTAPLHTAPHHTAPHHTATTAKVPTDKEQTVLKDAVSDGPSEVESDHKHSRAPSLKKRANIFVKSFRKAGNNDSDLLDTPDNAVDTSSDSDISRFDSTDSHKAIEPQSAPVLMAHQEKGLMKRMGGLFRASVIAMKNSSDERSQSESDVKRGDGRDENFNVIDLTSDDPGDYKAYIRKMSYAMHANLDKSDGSFSRSRSSSMSSLENISKEAIQHLVFVEAYINKTDAFCSPSLWVGTTLGSVLVISLNIPADEELRKSQPVMVSPSGTIFRLKGLILTINFMECSFAFNATIQQSDSYKERAREDWIKDRKNYSRQQSVSNMKARMSPTSSTENANDRQLAIICSERHARVIALPSQTCASKVKITDTSVVVKAEVIPMKDSLCLGCYIANGHILMFGLPSLKPLLDVDHMPVTDVRVAKTFSFSQNGHALYFCSPSEVQKITLSADICENLNEMLGELFLPCETPEAPKISFFNNLFGGGQKQLDREELFGESSGKVSIGVAKYTAGNAGMTAAQTEASGAMGDVARAKQALIERGAALSNVEDVTAKMMESAHTYGKSSHDIMLKFKDKKWYQF